MIHEETMGLVPKVKRNIIWAARSRESPSSHSFYHNGHHVTMDCAHGIVYYTG
jgi:hypothetical protein